MLRCKPVSSSESSLSDTSITTPMRPDDVKNVCIGFAVSRESSDALGAPGMNLLTTSPTWRLPSFSSLLSVSVKEKRLQSPCEESDGQ